MRLKKNERQVASSAAAVVAVVAASSSRLSPDQQQYSGSQLQDAPHQQQQPTQQPASSRTLAAAPTPEANGNIATNGGNADCNGNGVVESLESVFPADDTESAANEVAAELPMSQEDILYNRSNGSRETAESMETTDTDGDLDDDSDDSSVPTVIETTTGTAVADGHDHDSDSECTSDCEVCQELDDEFEEMKQKRREERRDAAAKRLQRPPRKPTKTVDNPIIPPNPCRQHDACQLDAARQRDANAAHRLQLQQHILRRQEHFMHENETRHERRLKWADVPDVPPPTDGRPKRVAAHRKRMLELCHEAGLPEHYAEGVRLPADDDDEDTDEDEQTTDDETESRGSSDDGEMGERPSKDPREWHGYQPEHYWHPLSQLDDFVTGESDAEDDNVAYGMRAAEWDTGSSLRSANGWETDSPYSTVSEDSDGDREDATNFCAECDHGHGDAPKVRTIGTQTTTECYPRRQPSRPSAEAERQQRHREWQQRQAQRRTAETTEVMFGPAFVVDPGISWAERAVHLASESSGFYCVAVEQLRVQCELNTVDLRKRFLDRLVGIMLDCPTKHNLAYTHHNIVGTVPANDCSRIVDNVLLHEDEAGDVAGAGVERAHMFARMLCDIVHVDEIRLLGEFMRAPFSGRTAVPLPMRRWAQQQRDKRPLLARTDHTETEQDDAHETFISRYIRHVHVLLGGVQSPSKVRSISDPTCAVLSNTRSRGTDTSDLYAQTGGTGGTSGRTHCTAGCPCRRHAALGYTRTLNDLDAEVGPRNQDPFARLRRHRERKERCRRKLVEFVRAVEVPSLAERYVRQLERLATGGKPAADAQRIASKPLSALRNTAAANCQPQADAQRIASKPSSARPNGVADGPPARPGPRPPTGTTLKMAPNMDAALARSLVTFYSALNTRIFANAQAPPTHAPSRADRLRTMTESLNAMRQRPNDPKWYSPLMRTPIADATFQPPRPPHFATNELPVDRMRMTWPHDGNAALLAELLPRRIDAMLNRLAGADEPSSARAAQFPYAFHYTFRARSIRTVRLMAALYRRACFSASYVVSVLASILSRYIPDPPLRLKLCLNCLHMCGSQLEEDFVEMAATAAARHQYAAAAAIGHPLDRVFARFVDHVHVARFRVAERLVRQCLELVTMRSHDWRPYRRTPEMHRHLVVADLFTRVCFQPDRLPGFAWLLQRRLHEVNAADADVVDMALIVADAMLADPFDYADKHDEEDFGRLDAYEMLMDFDGNLKQAHQKWGDGAELPQPSLWRYRVPASAAAAQHERQRFAMLMCCIVVGDPLGATFGVEATLPVAVRTRFAETIRTRIMDEVNTTISEPFRTRQHLLAANRLRARRAVRACRALANMQLAGWIPVRVCQAIAARLLAATHCDELRARMLAVLVRISGPHLEPHSVGLDARLPDMRGIGSAMAWLTQGIAGAYFGAEQPGERSKTDSEAVTTPPPPPAIGATDVDELVRVFGGPPAAPLPLYVRCVLGSVVRLWQRGWRRSWGCACGRGPLMDCWWAGMWQAYRCDMRSEAERRCALKTAAEPPPPQAIDADEFCDATTAASGENESDDFEVFDEGYAGYTVSDADVDRHLAAFETLDRPRSDDDRPDMHEVPAVWRAAGENPVVDELDRRLRQHQFNAYMLVALPELRAAEQRHYGRDGRDARAPALHERRPPGWMAAERAEVRRVRGALAERQRRYEEGTLRYEQMRTTVGDEEMNYVEVARREAWRCQQMLVGSRIAEDVNAYLAEQRQKANAASAGPVPTIAKLSRRELLQQRKDEQKRQKQQQRKQQQK